MRERESLIKVILKDERKWEILNQSDINEREWAREREWEREKERYELNYVREHVHVSRYQYLYLQKVIVKIVKI